MQSRILWRASCRVPLSICHLLRHCFLRLARKYNFAASCGLIVALFELAAEVTFDVFWSIESNNSLRSYILDERGTDGDNANDGDENLSNEETFGNGDDNNGATVGDTRVVPAHKYGELSSVLPTAWSSLILFDFLAVGTLLTRLANIVFSQFDSIFFDRSLMTRCRIFKYFLVISAEFGSSMGLILALVDADRFNSDSVRLFELIFDRSRIRLTTWSRLSES